MDDFSLRQGVVEDLPFILRAERSYMVAIEPDQLSGWMDGIDRNLALWIQHLARTTVLLVDEAFGGFFMWAVAADEDAAVLVTIQVLPEFRRRGFALGLLQVFQELVWAAGLSAIKLGVHERNPARRLYAKAGYRVVGRDGPYLLHELGQSAPSRRPCDDLAVLTTSAGESRRSTEC